MELPTVSEMETYIRQAATARGIDPDIAVKVARSEGLAPNTWQSNYKRGGYREPSYGPFQLLQGGSGTGFPKGMGNDFRRQTGLDPSDPENTYAAIDFALDQAARGGWGPWYGAAKVGVGRRDGLQGAQPIGITGRRGASPELSAFAEMIEQRPQAQLPVDTSFQALGSMNTTAAPTPARRRSNPANPSFADNAVGDLQNKDYGYQDNIRSTADLMGALGAPSRSNQSNQRIADAFSAFDNVSSGTAASNVPQEQRTTKRGQVPGNISRNAFDTMRAPNSVPASRFDQAFGAFDAVDPATAANTSPPVAPLSPPQTVSPPPTVTPPVSARPDMTVPQSRPYDPVIEPPTGPLRRARDVAKAALPSSLPAKAGTLLGSVLGGPAGMLAGRLAGGGINALMQGRAPMISVGSQSFDRTPLGKAVQAGSQRGNWNSQNFTRAYAQAGGADDPRSWSRMQAEDQRQRSRAGQKTVMDAFGGLFGGRAW